MRVAAADLPVAFAHQRRVVRDAGLRQRLPIALQALAGGLDPAFAVDEADAAVAVRQQVGMVAA
jgi:hypothetical protein